MNLNDSKDSYRLDIEPKKELKILIIGDCQVGKTSLSLKYFNSNRTKNDSFNHFKQSNDECDLNNNSQCIHSELNSAGCINQYSPTTLSVYRCDVKINFTDYSLSLTDTSGCRQNEKFVNLRKQYYSIAKDIDVIIMAFSLVDPVSFSNISKKWYQEVRTSYTDVPILLVGTKLDIKHQIKYQKKHNLNKKISVIDEQHLINTPELISKHDHHFETNHLHDESNGNLALTIENTAALINNKLASNKTDQKNSKKKSKCNYCSNLEQKSRSSKTSFLSTLTSRAQIENRTRAVSIISEVSQQHTVLIPSGSNDPIVQLPSALNDPIDEQTKLLENIHESNNNMISILNEDTGIRYNIDEYGIDDNLDDPFGSNYFKNLNLFDENCVCIDCNKNEVNSYDYDLDHMEQIEMINDQFNMKAENLCESNTEMGNKAEDGSVKTFILDSSDDLNLNRHNLSQQKETDSECDKEINKKSTELLVKRKDCVKLKQSMNAKKYLECSCLDDISVKIVMDTAIELALGYHLNKSKIAKQNLSKQASNCSKNTMQTNKNNSLFKYTGLIGSLMKESSSSTTNSNMNTSNPISANSKEFSLFSLKKNTSKLIQNEKLLRDYKSCDEKELDDLKDENFLIKKYSVKSKDLSLISNYDRTSNRIESDISCFRSAKSKYKSKLKSDKQLSLRCLSCTRGINDTSNSLNKI